MTATVVEATERPAYRAFEVRVAARTQLSPHFVRLTFTGDDLHEFGNAGLDQRIKLILPHPVTGMETFPRKQDWYSDWRLQDEDSRCDVRTYTVRAVRQELREVDVDFVCHGDTGPGSAFACYATVGDELIIIGPDDLSPGRELGIDYRPGFVDSHLLVGDETAAPAICAIIESLGADARGLAVIEVPSADDALHVDAPAGMTVKWLAREGARGERLTAEVRDWVARTCAARCCDTCDIAALEIPDDELLWEVPEGTSADGGLYAWLAGEAGVIRSLRRFLVGDAGMDRRRVAFMGYWRVGAEG